MTDSLFSLTAADYLILLGIALNLLLAIGQFLERPLMRHDCLLALNLFCMAAIQLAFVSYFDNSNSWKVEYLHLPFAYFIGPGVYHYFSLALNDDYRPGKLAVMAYLPGLLLLIALIGGRAFDLGVTQRETLAIFADAPYHFLDVLSVLILGSTLFFHAWLLYRGKSLFNFKINRGTDASLAFVMFMGALIATEIFGVVVYLAKSLTGLKVSMVVVTLFGVFVLFFQRHFPQFFVALGNRLEAARYERSQIKDLNLAEVHEKLIATLDDKEIYTEESLTLAELAQAIGIQSYQLSEFLNSHWNTSFSEVINKRRAERAAEEIRKSPETDVLSIAFSVGFNSKPTFNRAFKKYMGATPSEYKKRSA